MVICKDQTIGGTERQILKEKKTKWGKQQYTGKKAALVRMTKADIFYMLPTHCRTRTLGSAACTWKKYVLQFLLPFTSQEKKFPAKQRNFKVT